MLKPYIGITDFTCYPQVQAMQMVFRENHRFNRQERILHVGVMMSRKTLNDIETKWAKAFPPKTEIAKIFGSDKVMNCLHYVDSRSEGFVHDLVRAISYGGIGIHAIQLDMTWPDAREIFQAVHISRKQLEVILQVGKGALQEVQNDPEKMILRLEEYEDIVHRVLLDLSMGEGVPMSAEVLLPYARAIRKRFPNMGIVVAGGLCAESMHLLVPILKEFPDVSIDAQGKLRASGKALDPVEWERAAAYLIKAIEVLP